MEETNFDKKLNSCNKGSHKHNRTNDESVQNKDTSASSEYVKMFFLLPHQCSYFVLIFTLS